ncbi:Tonoplast monosaccharide transporters 2 [Heracleum sosnowskyi]|uniref:Tonoplast monosaccharide transporters 2 n=1 Tax=Heracleum sosnowskyi TaxID=360622 RepID=A0AAD8ID11_9APIA|nr:Tonoplast monosaccharide transporters 2 [Heracleum sosnowskyi]
MNGAVLVAIAATIGNLLQGWDNATIAGSVSYIKKEFNLETQPTLEGLIVSMSLISATVITACSGAMADWLGRRPLLVIAAFLYFVSGLVMLWSPNVYVLLLARLLDGFGMGLAVTMVPIYISEIAPPEIRGTLNTLPQFTGSAGMFLSYCMIFGMSLTKSPSWRIMLSILSIPSLFYFVLAILFLPETPRWLVSKGQMLEAKKVLQRLRDRDDVAGELALLVEGLGVGGQTSLEKYILCPADVIINDQDAAVDEDSVRLYGTEGLSWVARPVTGQNSFGLPTRQESFSSQIAPFVDPLVTLFSSVHEKLPDTGDISSMLFPNFGSMFSVAGNQQKNEDWDEESLRGEGEEYTSDVGNNDSDDNMRSPLISRQTTSLEKDMVQPASNGNPVVDANGEPVNVEIGGGWQLAWKWTEKEGQDGTNEGYFKRIYMLQDSAAVSCRPSLTSTPAPGFGVGVDVPEGGEFIQADALVGRAALYSKEIMDRPAVGPAVEAASGSSWSDLFEPGVKHALFVGAGIQILQQFSGISGVVYYTPQILEHAGICALVSNIGISTASSCLLITAIMTLLTLPCIAVAMRLMDVAGRRSLLLGTIPVLIVALGILVLGSFLNLGTVVNAIIPTVSVLVYFCCFFMGFGPIPNILCAEIFPTRVRGLCIAICSLIAWICDIIITYSLPMLLPSIGLSGIFGIYAVVCIISWVFVLLKVPETKGMPLEVITEFFSVGAKQAAKDI